MYKSATLVFIRKHWHKTQSFIFLGVLLLLFSLHLSFKEEKTSCQIFYFLKALASEIMNTNIPYYIFVLKCEGLSGISLRKKPASSIMNTNIHYCFLSIGLHDVLIFSVVVSRPNGILKFCQQCYSDSCLMFVLF